METNNLSKILLRVGLVLGALAIWGLFLIFYPVIFQEIKYRFIGNRVEEVVLNDGTENAENEPKTIVVADKDFGIVVPKIGANAKVIEDVDPYNQNEYLQALTRGVAHAEGTDLPGEGGNTFIFAHSTDNFYNANRYNSIFYLLNKLELNDKIFIAHENELFEYKVNDIKIVESDAVEYLDELSDKETITLMTCWPAGTTEKRLIVVGELVN